MEEFRSGRAVFDTVSGEVTIELEIADTPEAVKLGLMHRESLPPDRGMLFIFPDPRTTGPHMKNVGFPLSAAFLDDGGTIVEILDMDVCKQLPCPRYNPRLPFARCLEVNIGTFERLGVQVGDRLRIL